MGIISISGDCFGHILSYVDLKDVNELWMTGNVALRARISKEKKMCKGVIPFWSKFPSQLLVRLPNLISLHLSMVDSDVYRHWNAPDFSQVSQKLIYLNLTFFLLDLRFLASFFPSLVRLRLHCNKRTREDKQSLLASDPLPPKLVFFDLKISNDEVPLRRWLPLPPSLESLSINETELGMQHLFFKELPPLPSNLTKLKLISAPTSWFQTSFFELLPRSLVSLKAYFTPTANFFSSSTQISEESWKKIPPSITKLALRVPNLTLPKIIYLPTTITSLGINALDLPRGWKSDDFHLNWILDLQEKLPNLIRLYDTVVPTFNCFAAFTGYSQLHARLLSRFSKKFEKVLVTASVDFNCIRKDLEDFENGLTSIADQRKVSEGRKLELIDFCASEDNLGRTNLAKLCPKAKSLHIAFSRAVQQPPDLKKNFSLEFPSKLTCLTIDTELQLVLDFNLPDTLETLSMRHGTLKFAKWILSPNDSAARLPRSLTSLSCNACAFIKGFGFEILPHNIKILNLVFFGLSVKNSAPSSSQTEKPLPSSTPFVGPYEEVKDNPASASHLPKSLIEFSYRREDRTRIDATSWLSKISPENSLKAIRMEIGAFISWEDMKNKKKLFSENLSNLTSLRVSVCKFNANEIDLLPRGLSELYIHFEDNSWTETRKKHLPLFPPFLTILSMPLPHHFITIEDFKQANRTPPRKSMIR